MAAPMPRPGNAEPPGFWTSSLDADQPAGEFVEWARCLLAATDPRRDFPALGRSGPTDSGPDGAGQSRR